MWLVEHGTGGRPSIASETAPPVTGYGCDGLRLTVDSTHKVILHFDKIHVAVAVKADLVRFVELRFQGLPPFAGITAPPATGHGGQFAARKIEAAHTVVSYFSDVQRAIWANFDTEWVTDVGITRGA
jgi:hypothetical protein